MAEKPDRALSASGADGTTRELPTEVLLLNEYQVLAHQTAVYDNGSIPPIVYCTLKLTGEAGEVSDKLGKIFRDCGGIISEADRSSLARELGDVLWYIQEAAGVLGFSLSEIAKMNLTKLYDRKSRGVLGGSGDTR